MPNSQVSEQKDTNKISKDEEKLNKENSKRKKKTCSTPINRGTMTVLVAGIKETVETVGLVVETSIVTISCVLLLRYMKYTGTMVSQRHTVIGTKVQSSMNGTEIQLSW